MNLSNVDRAYDPNRRGSVGAAVFRRRAALLAAGLVVLLLSSTVSLAETTGEFVVMGGPGVLYGGYLPDPDFAESLDVDALFHGLTLHPESGLWTLAYGTEPGQHLLLRIAVPTGVETVATLDERILEPYALSVGPMGRLFVLSRWHQSTVAPPGTYSEIHEIDPASGQSLWSERFLVLASGMAQSPNGVWLVSPGEVRELDVLRANVVLGEPIPLDFYSPVSPVASDSAGDLWFIATHPVLDPPAPLLWRFEPDTGLLEWSSSILPDIPTGLAIDRRCREDATRRCLDGRFEVSVSWRDFELRSGEGQVAPLDAADSALFWFFEASNWELLVKVIDGCQENGHFWVFAAGTTDVEYELTVRDTLTNEVFTFENPLGRASDAVTATDAFATCGE